MGFKARHQEGVTWEEWNSQMGSSPVSTTLSNEDSYGKLAAL